MVEQYDGRTTLLLIVQQVVTAMTSEQSCRKDLLYHARAALFSHQAVVYSMLYREQIFHSMSSCNTFL